MALINCPECGKEVSDKAENCIHCGFPLYVNDINEDNSIKDFKGKRKIILTLVFILYLLIFAITILLIINPNIKTSIKVGKDLKQSLRNPDSLYLTDDVIRYDFSESFEEGEYIYYVISYRAENGYAGQTNDIAVYDNQGNYLGNSSDYELFLDGNRDEISKEMMQFCYCLENCSLLEKDSESKFILSILIPCKLD